MEQFAVVFEKEYNASQLGDTATEKWEALRDTIHRTALAPTFGKKTSKSHDWESSHNSRSPNIKSVDKLQVNYDDEDGRVQRLRPKHLVVWQRYMDHVRPPGEKAQHFPPQSLRRLLDISWKDKVTNTDVLSHAGLPTMYTLLRKRLLRWLGHIYRI